jgi:glycosyltransferase involved in cell wall biosynthesis
MRILHVLECFAPRYGGPVSVLQALACAQAEAGHTVTICTTNRDYPTGILRPAGKDSACGGRVEVHYFPVQIGSLKISVQLGRFVRDHIEQFDIVHIHGLYRFPTTYAARTARKRGVPYIIRPHGSLAPYLHFRSAQSVLLKRLYERFFDLPNLNAASAIHFATEGEREDASFLKLRSPSFVIPNGLDWRRYDSLPPRGSFRAARGLGNAPVVLFLGRVHPSKGLDLLIPAFQSLLTNVPDAKLVIVGPQNDDYGRQLGQWVREGLLTDSVRFVGFLEGEDVLQAYVDADIYALPSYTESFGMTIVEAMACGLPVVVSDRVSLRREILNAEAGLVTSCSIDSVAAALGQLLASEGWAKKLGAAGRRLVRNHYSWPRIVETLTEQYDRILHRTNEPNT